MQTTFTTKRNAENIVSILREDIKKMWTPVAFIKSYYAKSTFTKHNTEETVNYMIAYLMGPKMSSSPGSLITSIKPWAFACSYSSIASS